MIHAYMRDLYFILLNSKDTADFYAEAARQRWHLSSMRKLSDIAIVIECHIEQGTYI